MADLENRDVVELSAPHGPGRQARIVVRRDEGDLLAGGPQRTGQPQGVHLHTPVVPWREVMGRHQYAHGRD